MKDGSISNLRTWKKQDIIDEYAASTELQPPEKAILDTLRDQLRQMKMLDIGVGGGRTTMHFAQAAQEYWAIDYSEEISPRAGKGFEMFLIKSGSPSAMRGP
jgi:ubiquinone/menaquinone biosynthesis C-methylase UbiE